MAKSKQTVSEVQLKARRTSLGKKSIDELITIILRKDKSERSMNAKIQELTTFNEEVDSLNKNQTKTIIELKKDSDSMKDKINTLIERNDNLLIDKNNADKEVVRLKDKCNTLQKIVWTCFGVIVILGISLFIF